LSADNSIAAHAAPICILGFTLQVPQPYAAGHVCTASEAEALNRLLLRGVSKGIHKALVSSLTVVGRSSASVCTDEERAEVLASGQTYVADFVSGFAEGHEVQRAIRIECLRIARTRLEAQLYRQGRKLANLSQLELETALDQLAQQPAVREEAERRVRITLEVANAAHDELAASLGLTGDGGDGQ